MTFQVQDNRSNTLNQRPLPNTLLEGQTAVNFNKDSAGFFFRNTEGGLVKVGPVFVGPNEPVMAGWTTRSQGEMWFDNANAILYIWSTNRWLAVGGGGGGGGVAGVTTVNGETGNVVLDASDLNYLEGSAGSVIQTIAAKLKESVSVKDFGAKGDGTTNDSSAFLLAINATNTLVVPPGTYRLDSTVTFPERLALELQGTLNVLANVTVNGPLNVTGNGGFIVADSTGPSTSLLKLREAANPTYTNPYLYGINPLWFDGADIGAKINKAFRAGGIRATVRVPNGRYTLSTTIIMNESGGGSQISLLGDSSYMAPTFEMPYGSSMVGINMFGSDEAFVSGVRILEGSGSPKTCCAIMAGGTSALVENVWLSNTKYGFIQNSGNGGHYSSVTSEFCTYGMLIGSRFTDYSLQGGTVGGTTLQNNRYDKWFLHECGSGNSLGPAGLRVSNFSQLTVTGTSGTIAAGDTLTYSNGTTVVLISTSTTELCAEVDAMVGSLPTLPATFTTSSGGAGTVSSIKTNTTRELDFAQLSIKNCRRYGAFITNGKGLLLQGIFSTNGAAASSAGGGLYSAGTSTGWAVNVTGSVFIDNKISSGAGGEGANIRNGTFMFSGCQFTNTSSVVQTTGVKQASSGTAAVTGCTFLNVTTATDGTITATGCIGA